LQSPIAIIQTDTPSIRIELIVLCQIQAFSQFTGKYNNHDGDEYEFYL